MANAIKSILTLQVKAGAANPAPPIGPALGQHGVNIQQFCLQFNEATKERIGEIVPAVITVYEDRTFSFILKTPPASDLLRKAAGIEKGSGTPPSKMAGTITKAQLKEIAEKKMEDLNASNVEGAMRIIEGTARSMGIEVK
ncbi:MAG: 50S ribosomal protein L11 [Nanoarchaeota archaeon]|nr:50S ribosomal protein L11 [Nanoarchaeota archaeon]